MSQRTRFWLYATMAFLWSLFFVQALFYLDDIDDFLHAGTAFWLVVEVALIALAVRAWRAWRLAG